MVETEAHTCEGSRGMEKEYRRRHGRWICVHSDAACGHTLLSRVRSVGSHAWSLHSAHHMPALYQPALPSSMVRGYSASSSRLTMSMFSASRNARALALVRATRRKCGLTFLVTLSGVASPHSVYVPNGNTATAWASDRPASLYVQSAVRLG